MPCGGLVGRPPAARETCESGRTHPRLARGWAVHAGVGGCAWHDRERTSKAEGPSMGARGFTVGLARGVRRRTSAVRLWPRLVSLGAAADVSATQSVPCTCGRCGAYCCLVNPISRQPLLRLRRGLAHCLHRGGPEAVCTTRRCGSARPDFCWVRCSIILKNVTFTLNTDPPRRAPTRCLSTLFHRGPRQQLL